MPRSVAELLPFIPPATASQTGLATAEQVETIERLELIAGDGDTINEGTDFLAGATYTVDPANARDRWLKVLGAADGPLTANMIVDLNVAAGGWAGQQGGAVGMVRKADSSTFTVTVTGFDTSGTGTRVLERHHDFVLWRLVTTDLANGPGPGGSKFDDMVRIRRANSTQIAQATDTERLVTPASLAPLVAAQLVPSGTLRITGFTLTAGVQDAISSSGGTFVITFPAGAAAPVGCRVGLYLKDITNPVTFAVTDGSTVDGFNLAVDSYSLDGPDDAALAWRRESSTAWVYDGLTGVLSGGGGGGGGTIPVQDEGVEVLAAPTALDFRGAGVTATNVGGVARMTIAGGGSAATYLFEEFEFPEERTYSLVGYSPFAGTIATLRHFTISGTCTVAIKIGGVNVTGLSAVAMSSTPGTATATAPNTVSIGSRVEVAFTNILVGAPVRANLTLLFS